MAIREPVGHQAILATLELAEHLATRASAGLLEQAEHLAIQDIRGQAEHLDTADILVHQDILVLRATREHLVLRVTQDTLVRLALLDIRATRELAELQAILVTLERRGQAATRAIPGLVVSLDSADAQDIADIRGQAARPGIAATRERLDILEPAAILATRDIQEHLAIAVILGHLGSAVRLGTAATRECLDILEPAAIQ